MMAGFPTGFLAWGEGGGGGGGWKLILCISEAWGAGVSHNAE